MHFREPGQLKKEGILNGSRAALKGGVTTVLDMPNNRPPTTTRERFDEKLARFAKKSRVNYGLFFHAEPEGEASPADSAGAKIYMAKASEVDAVGDADVLEAIFRKHRRVTVHAEDEREFSTVWKKSAEVFHGVENGAGAAGGPDGEEAARDHHARRPRRAVRQALESIETAWRRIPRAERPRLVLAHCATADEVEWVASMKRRGYDVWAETCPHYFLLTQEDYQRVGPRLQVNPPLRSEADRAAVMEGARSGGIDFVSTDHAPHLGGEKESALPPSGIAGIEWLAPILLTLALRGEFSWQRYLEMASARAASCYGLADRGVIREGAWADLTVAEWGPVSLTGDEAIVTRANWNPYGEWEMSARVRAVLVNGQVAWMDGRGRNARYGRGVYDI